MPRVLFLDYAVQDGIYDSISLLDQIFRASHHPPAGAEMLDCSKNDRPFQVRVRRAFESAVAEASPDAI
jgi:hypothetical protein